MSLWTVLVVDDNPAVRRLICQLFARESDFQVCAEAENGSEALLKAQQFEPDLVVTDLSMPQMNGLEEIRALNKLRLTTPVILYSAHMDSFVEKEAFAAGASAVVPKINVVAVLIPTARTLLERLAA
jgi:two-component system nitrate/nitrite response regulator NarP